MSWGGRRTKVLIDPLQYKLLFFSLAYMLIPSLTFAVAAFGPVVLDLDDSSLTWEEKPLCRQPIR